MPVFTINWPSSRGPKPPTNTLPPGPKSEAYARSYQSAYRLGTAVIEFYDSPAMYAARASGFGAYYNNARLARAAMSILGSEPYYIVTDDDVSIYDTVLARAGQSISDTVEIIEGATVISIVLIVVVSDDVEMDDTPYPMVGTAVVVDEDVEIIEDPLIIEGMALVIDETIEITESAVRHLASFFSTPTGSPEAPQPENDPNVNEVSFLDIEVLDGRRRIVVKKVPKERAAHIDEKTIVGIDNEFRRLSKVIKSLKQQLDRKADR